MATIEKAIVYLANVGFRLDEIHRGCQNHLHTDLSYEFIQSVIERHRGARLPDPPSPATLNATRLASRSSSIAASPVPSNSEFNRELSPMPKSPTIAPSSNIMIHLDELSPEERLKALEALQSDLPSQNRVITTDKFERNKLGKSVKDLNKNKSKRRGLKRRELRGRESNERE